MRILVVEDDKKLASFLKQGLEEEHYAVDMTHDGENGWLMSQVYDYDCLILDIMLPEMDGLTLCRKIRNERQDTPIILLTARDSVDDKVSGLDVGADDYVVKPFAFEELLARIRALLRRKNAPVITHLQVADLELDPVRHRVSRDGQPIELTGREYALLAYLVRHADEVVTRTQLIEHVWDQHFDSDTNVIDVYISYLRQKVDRPYPKKLLHTVRGVGYTLRDA